MANETQFRPTIAEKCGRALTSRDLRMVLTHSCDADIVTAMGIVARKNPLGVAVLRAQCEQSELNLIALQEAQKTAWKLAEKAAHARNPEWWKRFSIAAVSHWIDPNCKVCHGRRFDPIPGAPALSATTCQACRGTGVKRAPRILSERMDRKPWSEIWQAVQTRLETRQASAESRMRGVLR
jgi:cytochrome c5